MGIVVAGVRLIKPKYDFVLKTAEKVDTRTLQRKMENFVFDAFRAFKPLRHKFKQVLEVKEEAPYGTYSYWLCMGEWIREKSRYYKYGSLIESPKTFLKTIKKYGDELKPHVRKPIKEDFAKAVDLVKHLIEYDDVIVDVEPRAKTVETYNFLAHKPEPVEIKPIEIGKLLIKTENPRRVYYQGSLDGPYIELYDGANVAIIEDLIDDLAQLFKKAEAEVGKVREHNEHVMEQIEDVVAPYKIMSSLR